MVVAIVGCGSSGKAIGYLIAKNKIFPKIKLIDFDKERSNKLSEELNRIADSLDIVTYGIDVNSDDVSGLLNDVDVIINAASPLCNIPLMKACLKSNTHYIDLASDPFSYSDVAKGTTLDEQLSLNNKFLNNDLLAVTNAGFSPGFTDVICKYVTNKFSLDSIDYFKVFFAENIKSDKFVVSWSPYIFMLESISPPTVYKKGNIINLTLQDSSRDIKFPEPVGKVNVRPFNGHPELRTIPDFLNIPIDYIEISGGMKLNDMQLNDIIVEALIKQVDNSPVFNGDIFDIISKSFEDPDTFVKNYKEGIIKTDVGCCLIEMKGKAGENDITYKSVIQHDLKDEINKIPSPISAFFVSFVPSIIAKAIIDGEIKNRGVVAPAALEIASEIINECKNMGMNIGEFFD